jgi:hypothetical protein
MDRFVYRDTFHWKVSLCISRHISKHDGVCLYGTFNLKVCFVYFNRFSTRLCFVCYRGTVHWKFSLCISRQISIQDLVLYIMTHFSVRLCLYIWHV